MSVGDVVIGAVVVACIMLVLQRWRLWSEARRPRSIVIHHWSDVPDDDDQGAA
jgi:hypothetical protein